MSAMKGLKPLVATKNLAGTGSSVLSPLNLHWAGVGLLALVNVYLIAQMMFVWHASSNYNADAIARQQTALSIARVEVQPLRGLDAKLSVATTQADKFYRDRLPASDSEIVAELGVLAKKADARLAGAQYMPAAVLAGSAGELTELHIDARLSGDYRPLVLFLNSLERDKMFFVINGVTLTGQQSGTVNLRLRLTTYLRAGAMEPQTGTASPKAGTLPAAAVTTPAGGPR
jgi:type IV pilus assembly protein PilO